MPQINDVTEGLGSLAVVIPIGLWGISTEGLGLELVRGLQVSLALSVVAVWFLGRKLNARGVLGWAMGEKVKHRIFRMPMQWFSLVLLVFLAISFTVSPTGGA